VTAAGHLDSAPPAEVVFGAIATARGAVPAWDGAKCSNVYCHGSSTPTWTGTAADNAYCGSCHGLPPTTAAHTPSMALTDCATCHPASVTPYGGILVSNGKHMNGVVDAQ
jgi:predicted CxxxxCH...CXXCH cytochrome family protein